MCRIFKIHPSGFYAWLAKPLCDRAIEDQRLLKLIKEFYIASGATYGSPWIHRDLHNLPRTYFYKKNGERLTHSGPLNQTILGNWLNK